MQSSHFMRFFYQTSKSRGTAASLRYPIRQSLGGVELLENRLVLAVDMGPLDRPPLNQTDSVYIENSQIGPSPIVMSKSEIIGDETIVLLLQQLQTVLSKNGFLLQTDG